MMTPNTLARASQAFRRGYTNAHAGKLSAASDYVAGSFAREDYESGYRAAMTEQRIAREQAARRESLT